MRSLFLLIVSCLLFFSCSKTIPLEFQRQVADFQEQLMNIRIYRNNTLRFSGLMAITARQQEQSIILLDASGIMLLKGSITTDGKMVVAGGVNQLTDSQIPQILAQSVRRIYSIDPPSRPCSSNGLERICRYDQPSGDWLKTSRLWLLPYWKVRYTQSGTEEYRYRQPWLGLTITYIPIALTTQDKK